MFWQSCVSVEECVEGQEQTGEFGAHDLAIGSPDSVRTQDSRAGGIPQGTKGLSGVGRMRVVRILEAS